MPKCRRLLPSLLVLASSALILAGASAQAQAQAQTPQPTDEQIAKAKAKFQTMDTNGDGMISKPEWLAAGRRERGFAFIDTDHNGEVTVEELRVAAQKSGSRP